MGGKWKNWNKEKLSYRLWDLEVWLYILCKVEALSRISLVTKLYIVTFFNNITQVLFKEENMIVNIAHVKM